VPIRERASICQVKDNLVVGVLVQFYKALYFRCCCFLIRSVGALYGYFHGNITELADIYCSNYWLLNSDYFIQMLFWSCFSITYNRWIALLKLKPKCLTLVYLYFF